MNINPSSKDISTEYCKPTPLNINPINKLDKKTKTIIPRNDKNPNDTITPTSIHIKTNSINEYNLLLENREPIDHLEISEAYFITKESFSIQFKPYLLQ